jgi:hypothetical protein
MYLYPTKKICIYPCSKAINNRGKLFGYLHHTSSTLATRIYTYVPLQKKNNSLYATSLIIEHAPKSMNDDNISFL